MSTPTTAATEPDPVPADSPALGEATGKPAVELVGRSPGRLAWIRFRRDKSGILCALIVIAFIVIALTAP